jgi:uncharacterized Ntn-hydrolase superfamily protein
MTWSIVARDPASGAFGVAVATRFFATRAKPGGTWDRAVIDAALASLAQDAPQSPST